MKTFAEITVIADNHAQMREYSCVQSAIEMVLKLYGYLGQDEYPEQAHEELDGKGFIPWHMVIGARIYHGKKFTFVEEKFDNNLQPGNWKQAAWGRGMQLLDEQIYPIYSFEKPHKPGQFHCWLGIRCEDQYGMQFTTKPLLGLTEKEIQSQIGPVWAAQTKTEILIIRPV